MPKPPSETQKPPMPMKKKNHWKKLAETPIVPTPPEVMAALKAQGFTWTDIPETQEKALQRHREEHDKRQRKRQEAGHPEDTWINKAGSNLDSRLNRPYAGKTKPWHRDYKIGGEKDDDEQEDDSDHKRALQEGAADVSGLLNAAIIPPLGYFGDIEDLVRMRLLPDGELALYEASDAAQRKVWKQHDATFRVPAGAPRQRDVHEDLDDADDN
jgi:hypothetical protein